MLTNSQNFSPSDSAEIVFWTDH